MNNQTLNSAYNTLTIDWKGNAEAKEGSLLYLTVNGQAFEPISYKDAATMQVPLNTHAPVSLKVEVMLKPGDKKITGFKNNFNPVKGENHSCQILGKLPSQSGMKVKMSNGNKPIDDSTPACYAPGYVGVQSFFFPVYGIIRAIRTEYNRAEALACAGIGFGLATILSCTADRVAFGFGRHALFEYDPFSITDILINLLIGGIASLRGLIALFFS